MKIKDLRVLKTQKAILDAFLDLIKEKGMDSVTVQDIATRAMINRATFYAHYKDKEDLYEQVVDHLITTFTSVIEHEEIVEHGIVKIAKIENLLSRFYKSVKGEFSGAKVLLEGSNQEFIQRKFGVALREKYQEIFNNLEVREKEIQVPIDFIIEYMTGIFISTLRWWMADEKQSMTSEEMAQLVVKLIGNGHLTVLGVEVERE